MKYSAKKATIIMMCTSARGGMTTVVESYKKDGFFDSQNIRLISTHSDGSRYKEIWVFLKAFISLFYQLLFKSVVLVHIHSASKGSFWRKSLFSILALTFKKPVIFHLHGASMEYFYSSLPMIFQKYVRWVLERVTCVIVLSQSWKVYIAKIAPNSNIEVVNNYVTLPELGGKIDICESQNKKVTILFLGIVGKRKGVYDIIDAVTQIAQTNRNFEVLIGGNGEVDKARKEAKRKKIDDIIHFLGWVNAEKKEVLLSQADIYILPSYNEGLPMSLLEAMSWAVPVISTSVGGIPELIRNDTDGLVIEPGDIDGLSGSLLKLMLSKELRLKMGGNARARVEDQFSDLAVLPQLERIYTKLLFKE